jgi:hypothetical protein
MLLIRLIVDLFFRRSRQNTVSPPCSCRHICPRRWQQPLLHLRLNQVAELGRGELLVLFATSVLTLPALRGWRAACRAIVAAMAGVELVLMLC